MRNYAEAVYHVKRGFIVIGLTGYTGSGCTKVASILSTRIKPVLPGYDSIIQHRQHHLNKRIYDKLARVWGDLEWHPFTTIEVSKIIFAQVIYKALNSTIDDVRLNVIRKIADKHRTELEALKYLVGPKEDISVDIATRIIAAYKICATLYAPFKKESKVPLGEFIELMQNYGDNIRRYGEVCAGIAITSPDNLFVLPEATRRLMKAYDKADGARHFVIDAFRNPFEVEYFKRRYTEFYLVGIMRDNRERRDALRTLSEESMLKLEERERGGTIERQKNNIAEWVTSQNIDECLQKADYYLNNVNDTTKTYPYINFNLIKLMTLAKMPGCIPPSLDERGMQIAMTARQMSRCISRQVGASVLNENDYVIGIGWNDPPEGQVPCALRTGKELVENPCEDVFSDYERSAEFVQHIKQEHYAEHPFCFRYEYSKLAKGKRAEFTRALHAEENALFQASWHAGEKLTDSTLYTTASTCTLCAKKAYQLGISRIVYIEEYPGIAIDQTIKTGKKRMSIDRFEGVTGNAYLQLFSSLMPEKDLIQLYL